MRVVQAFAFALMAVSACHRRPTATPIASVATRSVFTDSVYHAEQCVPLKPGEDWRRVCTPKYQGHLPMALPEPRKP